MRLLDTVSLEPGKTPFILTKWFWYPPRPNEERLEPGLPSRRLQLGKCGWAKIFFTRGKAQPGPKVAWRMGKLLGKPLGKLLANESLSKRLNRTRAGLKTRTTDHENLLPFFFFFFVLFLVFSVGKRREGKKSTKKNNGYGRGSQTPIKLNNSHAACISAARQQKVDRGRMQHDKQPCLLRPLAWSVTS